MHISKLLLFFIVISYNFNIYNMNQNHEFDITKFNEKNYRTEITKIHPSDARDFLMNQLVDSMILIFELKQEKNVLEKQLTRQEKLKIEEIKTLTKLRNSLNDSQQLNQTLTDDKKSLGILNSQLYNRIKQDKVTFKKRVRAIQSLNEHDSV